MTAILALYAAAVGHPAAPECQFDCGPGFGERNGAIAVVVLVVAIIAGALIWYRRRK